MICPSCKDWREGLPPKPAEKPHKCPWRLANPGVKATAGQACVCTCCPICTDHCKRES